MRDETTYTIGEISKATGIKKSTLQGRRAARGIPARGEYTLDEVKTMIKKPRARKIPVREDHVARLKAKLMNDGAI